MYKHIRSTEKKPQNPTNHLPSIYFFLFVGWKKSTEMTLNAFFIQAFDSINQI